MSFEISVVLKMQSVLKQLAPQTIESIQKYTANQKNSINRTFGVKDKKGKYIYIFQFYQNLSKARIKILHKRKNEIPYPLHFIELENNFVCVGWKFEN